MTTTIEAARALGLVVTGQPLPPNKRNIPGTALKNGVADSLTIHATANTQPGADAQFHRRFVAGGGGPALASFTACVDDQEVVLIVAENQVTYHAGDGGGLGNTTSNSLEICEYAGINQAQALDNAAKYAAAWCWSHHADVGQVVQHAFWARTAIPHHKDCPDFLRRMPGGWVAWLALVERYLAQLHEQHLESAARFADGVPTQRLPPLEGRG